MNSNPSQRHPLPGDDEIREILVRRIDRQKQAIGMVVGIVDTRGRRVVAYGRPATGDPREVDGHTIFEIGSISKIFTSLLFAEMVGREEVALDERAAKYLPEHVRMPERSGKAVTLLDLSTHRSGLPPLRGNLIEKMANRVDPRGAPDYNDNDLYQFLSGYSLPRDPGSQYEYSNLGAGLLGHLLARRAGMDYDSLIRTRITQPLRMTDTGIALTSSMLQRRATGHSRNLLPVADSDLPVSLAGAGALRSSVNDMLTLLEAFLGYRDSPLAAAMKTTLEIRRPAVQAEIALGWLIYRTNGKEIIWHNGATSGFRSFLGYDPETRAGVVVLANSSTPSGVDDLGFHLLNPRLSLDDPEPPPQRTEITLDPEFLAKYTGRYQVTPALVLEITLGEGRLFAQGFAQLPHARPGDLTGLPPFELFADGEWKFFAKVSDSRITFETGPDGRATALTLHKGGRDIPAARLP